MECPEAPSPSLFFNGFDIIADPFRGFRLGSDFEPLHETHCQQTKSAAHRAPKREEKTASKENLTKNRVNVSIKSYRILATKLTVNHAC